MFRILCLVLGYFIGCLQTAYIVGKFKKMDIRDHGSGNAGTTNTIRVLGMKTGIIVFVCDVLKAVAAYWMAVYIFGDPLAGMYSGLGTILGHNFPFFMNFRGGKGVASSLGIILSTDWLVALMTFAVGICVVATSRYISLGALTVLGLFPIFVFFYNYPPEVVGISVVMTALAYFQLRGNIKRLVSGTESKFEPKWKR